MANDDELLDDDEVEEEPEELDESDLEDDQATAFVIVDVNVEGTSGRRQLVNEYLELSLVRLDEGWTVDNVRNLNFGRRGASASGSPSTTAAPAGGGAAPSG